MALLWFSLACLHPCRSTRCASALSVVCCLRHEGFPVAGGFDSTVCQWNENPYRKAEGDEGFVFIPFVAVCTCSQTVWSELRDMLLETVEYLSCGGAVGKFIFAD